LTIIEGIMTEDKFRLPGGSYDELCKIIKSYGVFDKAFSLEEASQVTKMDKTQISRNNGFLLAIGVIDGDKSKTTTELGKKLAHSLDYERGDEISTVWREIVLSSEFLTRMIAAVRIRKGMDIATLQGHIAYSAGQQKSKFVMTGARAIIDILLSSELLIEKDGQLVAIDKSSEMKIDEKQLDHDEETQEGLAKNNDSNLGGRITIGKAGTHVILQVNIDIRIDAKPDELVGLGAKVREIINDLISGQKQDD
jgi:hypothetical protein